MSMRVAILAALQGDAALLDLLPGGVHDRTQALTISRQRTPAAFDDNAELRACGLLAMGSDRRDGWLPTSSELGFTLYLYQRMATDRIDAARERIYELLHQVRLEPGSGQAWAIKHDQDILDRYDVTLDAALIVCRYRVAISKEDLVIVVPGAETLLDLADDDGVALALGMDVL